MDLNQMPSQSYLIAQHLTYLVLSLGTTAWVGRTLS